MLHLNFLMVLAACEDNFDKGGEVIEADPPADSDPEVEIDPSDPEDPNHDWDEDGFTENQGDCDDDNPQINPNAPEIYYDDLDQNCDGQHDFDADGDGHISQDWGGNDCNDLDANAYPDAPDDPTDGVDSDCDGLPDPRFVTDEIDPNVFLANGPNAMEVDSVGRVHVVYEDDGQLWYTTSSSFGLWRTPTQIKADNSRILASEGLDGAIDNFNRFHIGYTSQDIETGLLSLQYLYTPQFGQWSTEFEIDGDRSTRNSYVGYYVEIDLGSDNLPVFGYFSADQGAPYLTKLSTLPSSSSTTDFSYRAEADYLVYNASGADMGLHTSLAVGSDNRAHLIYRDNTAPYGTGTQPESQYSSRSNNGEVCESQTVANVGGYWHSVAIRGDGVVCVAYQEGSSLSLRYACQTNASSCTGWTTQTVDATFNVGAYASLDFTSYNQPYISYYDANLGALKVATQQGTNWDIYTIDDSGTKDVGRFTDLSIDEEDRVHITYQNTTDNSIWYALGR